MKSKDLLFKIIISIVALAIIIGAFFIVYKRQESVESGQVTIEIIDKDNEIVDTKNVYFKAKETMFEIVTKEFDIQYEKSSLGRFITKVGPIEASLNSDYFIQISVDDKISSTGIDGIKPVDGIKLTFKLVKIVGK